MTLKLHRCGTPWKLGPCWRVQKALDDERIPYEVVRGPWRPRERAAVREGTGQPLFPAIQFEHGGWYREESRDMARTIRAGRLPEKEVDSRPAAQGFPAQRGLARLTDRSKTPASRTTPGVRPCEADPTITEDARASLHQAHEPKEHQ